MKKSKIYLAKSNRSNPDDVSRVRQVLSNLNCQIIEFTGGRYTHKPLKECDMLVIVPDLSGYNKGDYDISVGKGLHEQIGCFRSDNYTTWESSIFIITDVSDYEIIFNKFEDFNFTDDQDFVNYSTMCISDDSDNLEYVLEERLGFDYERPEKKKYQYLLISKNYGRSRS